MCSSWAGRAGRSPYQISENRSVAPPSGPATAGRWGRRSPPVRRRSPGSGGPRARRSGRAGFAQPLADRFGVPALGGQPVGQGEVAGRHERRSSSAAVITGSGAATSWPSSPACASRPAPARPPQPPAGKPARHPGREPVPERADGRAHDQQEQQRPRRDDVEDRRRELVPGPGHHRYTSGAASSPPRDRVRPMAMSSPSVRTRRPAAARRRRRRARRRPPCSPAPTRSARATASSGSPPVTRTPARSTRRPARTAPRTRSDRRRAESRSPHPGPRGNPAERPRALPVRSMTSTGALRPKNPRRSSHGTNPTARPRPERTERDRRAVVASGRVRRHSSRWRTARPAAPVRRRPRPARRAA